MPRRWKNPLGPYPPGKTRRPRRNKAREAFEDELVREQRQKGRP